MRVSALMMETADQQRDFGEAIGSFRESLRNLLERQKDVQTIVRDREILVNRTLRLSSKRPNDKDNDKHRAKLDEASRELGACEVALKQEEAALSGVKARTLQEALGMRLRAQEDLGLLYIETAREGLEMLTQLDMDAITSTVRSRPLSPMGSPLGSPIPDQFSPPLSPQQQGARDGALPPTDDIPPIDGYDGAAAGIDHSRQRTTPAVRHSMAVPPTVPEDDNETEDSSAAEEAMLARNVTPHRNAAFGRSHKRGDSSDYGGTDTSKSKKKGGLFGSLGRLFKPRDSPHDEDGTPTKKSNKKGWSTNIDKNVAVQSALNEKAAKSERPWSPSRGRRNSDSSDEPDRRKLVKVVNKKPRPVWTPDPTTDMSPPTSVKGKTKSRKRSDSYTGTPQFSLPMSHAPRKAMSDSGLPDEPAQPVKMKKKKSAAAKTSAASSAALSRSPSSATAATATTVTTPKKPKRASAQPQQDAWHPRSQPVGLHQAPSLLSVVSDDGEAHHQSASNRRYLTSPANDALKPPIKRSKSVKSTTSTTKPKQRPASMAEATRSDYNMPNTELTTLALPSAAAFKHNSQNLSNQEEGNGLTTLHLPSASASRAYVAGSTLTLPSAPPPVSSMAHLSVPERSPNPPQKPQMKRSSSSTSASRTPTKSAPARSHSSMGLRSEPSLVERTPTHHTASSSLAPPASGARTRESKPKLNGILHSPGGTVRSASPDSTVSRRKSVRIQEGDMPPSASSRAIPDSFEPPAPESVFVDKGKNRASEADIQGWSSARRLADDTSDEEEDDVAEYRAVRT